MFTHLLTIPDTNSADTTVLSNNVVLQSNLKGKWERPNGYSVAESKIEFELFTQDLAGVYMFHVTSWSRSEVIAIQIEISAIGKFFNHEIVYINVVYAKFMKITLYAIILHELNV